MYIFVLPKQKQMKDFLSLLITIILSAFAVGTAFLSVNYDMLFIILIVPWVILALLWGDVLFKSYFKNIK